MKDLLGWPKSERQDISEFGDKFKWGVFVSFELTIILHNVKIPFKTSYCNYEYDEVLYH